MIDVVSKRIAYKIKTVVPEHPRSEQVLAYSVSFLLTTLTVIILSILISIFTDRFVETVIVLCSFALLRNIAGGLHFESVWLCIVVSTAIVTIITFADFGYHIIIILTSISLLLSLLLAPRIEKQTRIPKKYYSLLKVLSMVIISTSFLIDSPVVTTAFFVQCLTLIRYGKGVKTNQ